MYAVEKTVEEIVPVEASGVEANGTETVSAALPQTTTKIEVITEYQPEEKILRYLPIGKYKWSTFEVDTTDRKNPKVVVEVSIDGQVKWSYTINGKPVKLKSTTAIGAISEGFKGMLHKLGLGRSKSWF